MADDLQAWLKNLPGKLQRELSGKVKAQANRLSDAQRAKFEQMQTPPEETGGGAASIRVEPGKDETTFLALAGGPLTTKNGYDHMLGFEFGTQKQPARPFFYSTYQVMRADIREEIEQALSDALEKA